jgi:hypothetical protein
LSLRATTRNPALSFVIAGLGFVIAGLGFVIAGHDPQSSGGVALDPGC